MEYGTACYEDIGAGFDDVGGVFDSDAAVDFNQRLQSPVMDHPAEATNFLISMRDKFLAAKARINAHDQDSIQILQDIRQQFYGRGRIEASGGGHSQGFDLLNIAVQVTAGLELGDEAIRSGFFEG